MTNEPLRDVLLDNKQTVYGVPDEITDEEVKEAYKQNNEDSILEDVKDYFTSQQNINKEGFIGGSTTAYKRVYPIIAKAIESGEQVRVKYIDFDSGVRHS